ncbi:MAG: GNAT family N-acetyltransferase [Fimbriimonadaceae bacterium]|nr:GNAT family N-acetyltransferase [Chitinophagales bacterium]
MGIHEWAEKLVLLQTARISIRKLICADVQDYFIMYSDAEAMRYRGQMPFEKIEDAQVSLKQVQDDWFANIKFRVALVLKESNALIGTFLIKSIEEDSCEIGYSLDKNYWNQGIMTEVCRAVVSFLLEEAEMETIYAVVREGNESSMRLLQKLQFKPAALQLTGGKNISYYYRKKEKTAGMH